MWTSTYPAMHRNRSVHREKSDSYLSRSLNAPIGSEENKVVVSLFHFSQSDVAKMTTTDDWLNHSVCFRKIHEDLSRLEPDKPTRTEIKLYSKEQFRTHVNRVYPFHLDYFTSQLSALDFEQHRMGLYIFYDVNQGYLINDLDKESNKKTSRGKNIKVISSEEISGREIWTTCLENEWIVAQ